MSRRTNGGERRRLGLKRETVRRLSARDLGQVAGGTWEGSWTCGESYYGCAETTDCSAACTAGDCMSTGTRFC